MSTIKTGNDTHDTRVNTAEATRQSAVALTMTRVAVAAADATFSRAAATSAAVNSCGIVPFMTMLRELGQPLYP